MRSIPEATPIVLRVEERTELEVLARSMKAEHRKRQRRADRFDGGRRYGDP
jgi:hypothetical protein